jgi:hypothetical protein
MFSYNNNAGDAAAFPAHIEINARCFIAARMISVLWATLETFVSMTISGFSGYS